MVFSIPIRDRWQASIQARDFLNRLGNKILVFYCHQRQFVAGQLGNFAAPQISCLDNNISAHSAFVSHDIS